MRSLRIEPKTSLPESNKRLQKKIEGKMDFKRPNFELARNLESWPRMGKINYVFKYVLNVRSLGIETMTSPNENYIKVSREK